MAKIVNGELSGRVRDLVYRRTKDFGVVVSTFNDGSYKNRVWSEGQCDARIRFKVLSKLSGVFRECSNLGFALGKKVLSHPSFIKYNYGSVVEDGHGGVRVDEGELCLSQGSLMRFEGLECAVVGLDVVLRWRYESVVGVSVKGGRFRGSGFVDKSGGDGVVVVFYCPSCCDGWSKDQCVVVKDAARRDDCGVVLSVPHRFVGKECFVYLFATDCDCRSSDSQFVCDFVAYGSDEFVDRRFILGDDVADEHVEVVDEGFEDSDIVVDVGVSRSFVMRFSDDEDMIEDVVCEPVIGDDLWIELDEDVVIKSNAERVLSCIRMIIRDVNRLFSVRAMAFGTGIRFDSLADLCAVVVDSVGGCEGEVTRRWRMVV